MFPTLAFRYGQPPLVALDRAEAVVTASWALNEAGRSRVNSAPEKKFGIFSDPGSGPFFNR